MFKNERKGKKIPTLRLKQRIPTEVHILSISISSYITMQQGTQPSTAHPPPHAAACIRGNVRLNIKATLSISAGPALKFTVPGFGFSGSENPRGSRHGEKCEACCLGLGFGL